MPAYVFEPAGVPSVAVSGTDMRFPVRRIFCVGQNYAAHVREMGADPDRAPPFFFGKPADAVVDAGVDYGAVIPYPPQTANFHREIELVVAIGTGTGGSGIAVAAALGHVFGYGVGIDLTRRDVQQKAREAGRPWDWAKGFDNSAPCAAIHRIADVGHPATGRIWLAVDGAMRQDGDLGEQIWSVPEVIAAISQSVALRPGDLIFTGTPAGVGPLLPGNRVTGGIAGLGEIRIDIA
jgi:fumarylpyruvate hydrolase